MELFIKILYALPVYQSALFIILLFSSSKREKGYSKLIMGTFLSTLLIYFSFNLLYALKVYDALVILYFLIPPIILVFVPLFYLYLESATTPGFTLRTQLLIHFLPAAIFLLLQLPYFLASPQERYSNILFGDNQPFISPIIGYVHKIYIVGIYMVCNLQIMYYLYRSFQLFTRHKNYIANRYSYTENISVGWVKALIFSFVIFILVNELLFLFGIKHNPIARVFYNISMLVIILFTGYHGLMQKDLGREKIIENEEIAESIPQKIKYSGSTLKDAQKQDLITKLEILMLEEKVYTNNELSIDDVAQRLKTNSKYISQILNEHYQKNFFGFINAYRIKEAQRLLSEDKSRKYSVIGIAMMSGFASKTSFNETFKNIVGTTPSEFRKSTLG